MTRSEEATVRVGDPLCQFALRRATDDVLDDLIIAGADKVSLLQDNRSKGSLLQLSRSQIKNVVAVASETRSREAVTNFVRYQMGRQDGKAWRDKAQGHEAFGHEIIGDIEGKEGHKAAIDDATQKVRESVKKQLEQLGKTINDEAELEREARAQLIRLYLGYLNRTYAYCHEMDEPKDRACWEDVKRIAKRRREPRDV
jgi:hypothetical protein